MTQLEKYIIEMVHGVILQSEQCLDCEQIESDILTKSVNEHLEWTEDLAD